MARNITAYSPISGTAFKCNHNAYRNPPNK